MTTNPHAIKPTPKDRALADRICAMIAEHTHWACDEATRQVVNDYEEVLTDYRRLTRQIDVIINGEEGAAKQASLCDVVAQLRDIFKERDSIDQITIERLNLEVARLAEEERAVSIAAE